MIIIVLIMFNYAGFNWIYPNLIFNFRLCSNLSVVHYQNIPDTLLFGYVLVKRVCSQEVEPAKYVIT